MKNVQLSDRLRAVASLVTPGSRIADVGCDHGYIPIYLYLEGRIPGAIAMDVNRGPLLRAEQHIREYGLGKYIETRLSDGVKALSAGEADTVIIAGMGGPLMEKILTEGSEVLNTVSELVLQPQSEIGRFRHFLLDHGYRITAEDMVFEDGKYYPMMKAIRGEQCYEEEIEYLFGSALLKNRNPVLKQFLLKEQSSVEKIMEHLKNTDTRTGRERLLELEQELFYIKKALGLDSSGQKPISGICQKHARQQI